MTRRSDDRGVVAVETALVVPVLLALAGGVLLFGLRMWASATVDHAAQGALRDAVLRHGSAATAQTRPLLDGFGYRSPAGVLASVQTRLPGRPLPATCTGSGATAVLPPGADLCVAVSHQTGPAGKRQGDVVSVTVVQRVRAVEAAAQLVPFLGARRAAGVSTVRATALGRLE